MTQPKYEVPSSMFMEAIKGTWREGDRISFDTVKMVLVSGIRWQDQILKENNVDFSRAILIAEKKRIPGPDDNLMIIARRVDFEYGASFARNYIRDLYLARDPDKHEAIRDLLLRSPFGPTMTCEAKKEIKAIITEAFERGLKAKEKR